MALFHGCFMKQLKLYPFIALLCFYAMALGLEGVAFLDVPRIYDHYVKVQRIKKKLSEMREKSMASVKRKEKKIQILKNELSKIKETSDKDKIEKLKAEIRFLEEELAAFLFDQKQELKRREKFLVQRALKAVYQEVRKFAREYKYKLVVDSSRFIRYHDGQHDITEKLLSKITEERRDRELD